MPPLAVLIKPASGLCNLRCAYCFYHDVTEHRETAQFGCMTPETAQALIEKALAFADGESVSFAFQGGEPLIAGLDYFRDFLRIVGEKNSKKSRVSYSIQTNGTLLDADWARFFRAHRFLVGLSLDGNAKAHRFRTDANGESTWHAVINAAALLEKHGVEFNILTVLTGWCAEHIEEVYRFFRTKGFRHLQFIPCLRPFGDESESALYMTVPQYAQFLIKLFRLYARDYARGQYTSVRQLDNFVRLYLGQQPEQCGMAGHCMYQFVIEGNGNVYPCDFYCTDEWLLGSIREIDFKALSESENAQSFLQESFQQRPECKACRYYPICRGGGCKRSRADRNYCAAYQEFFQACEPLFQQFEKRYCFDK